MPEIYQRWNGSKDKGNLEFWRSEEFRNEYTRFEMVKKKEIVYSLIRKEMHAAIMSSDRTSYRVLSLGCGPGSDLLAAMQVFQSVCLMEELEPLTVKVTGVDRYEWSLDSFSAKTDAIERRGPIENFRDKFYFCSMQRYFEFARRSGKRFDFIILSFAEVKKKLEFVSNRLPELLRDEASRIFVIDNNIEPVRQLKRCGFEQIGTLAGKTICLMGQQ